MSKRTFDDFDGFAKDYRDIHTDNVKISGADSFYFAEMKVKLIVPYESNTALKILDIGCGDGATELFMQKYFSKWKIEGIDISEKSIDAATERALANANFLLYNGSTIPLPTESIDIAFIAGVLHHIDYKFHQMLVKEIARVLKKGGRLYLFEHNPLNPLTRYLVNTCVFDKDAKLLKSSYATWLLKQNNFTITFKKFIIFFPRKGIFLKLLFLEKYLQFLPLGGQYFIAGKK